MTLGARPGKIVWMVLRGVAAALAAGTLLGWVCVIALGRVMLLPGFEGAYGMPASDYSYLAIATVFSLGASALVGLVTAARAARIDPAISLRAE